jgi:pimeloyl-ACP methyl ester carboxylesterase
MATFQTPTIDISYADNGPKGGPVLLLLHGWPDDASTWDAIVPALTEAGLRTIVPMHRGFADSRFRFAETPRTANVGILAMDAIALLNGLQIENFSIAGHDWGSNMAEAMAAGWPDRVGKIAMLSTPPRLGGLNTPPFWHAQRQWYHWFQATKRGAQAVQDDPKGFAHIMWENWSPKGWFDEQAFDRVAASFENPDWVAITLHSYRSRWDEAEPDPASAWLETKVKDTKQLSLPAIYIQGQEDGVNPPKTSEKIAEKFSGPFQRIVLSGVGHFPTREAPGEVSEALLAHFTSGV